MCDHQDVEHDWKFSCCMCCNNTPGSIWLMRRAGIIKSFYSCTEEEAMILAKSDLITEKQINSMNMTLYWGSGDQKFAT